MDHRRAPTFLRLAGLLLCCCGAFAQPVLMGAASRTVAAKSQVPSVSSQGADFIDLGAPSRASLDTLEAADSRTDGPRQIGVARSVNEVARAGSLRIHSAGAGAIRVAIALRDVPAGAKVRFADTAGAVVHSVEAADVAAAVRVSGAYWGPVTSGAEQLVQLELPAGVAMVEGMLAARSVSHIAGDPALAPIPPGSAKSSGTCEQDVSCAAGFDDAVAKAGRSVAKIIYTVDGLTYMCTGTLVNSAGSAQLPYMLTAKHCIGSDAAAATVNTYWFFEAASCGARWATSPVQLTRGATLAYAGVVSDVALIKLNEPAPANAWFSGFDASAMTANDAAITVHHPLGDLKKLSTGRVIEPGASGTLMSVAWLSGTTEPGSSGSGLFTRRDDEYLLRGTLRGGSASCTNSGSLADEANRDYYARLDADSHAIAALMKVATEPGGNYSDIWTSLTEPGTGLSITHRAGSNAMFVVSFNYGPDGRAAWIVVQGGAWQSATTFTGPAYRASRNGMGVSQVPIGTVTLTFEGGRVTMLATFDGLPQRTGSYQRYMF